MRSRARPEAGAGPRFRKGGAFDAPGGRCSSGGRGSTRSGRGKVGVPEGGGRGQEVSPAGRWSDPFVIPVVGITSVVLNTGKVLFWSYEPANYRNPASSNTGVAYIWDPATRTGHSVTPPENIWCGGQTVLADGRVFLAGGNLHYPDTGTGWQAR